MNENSHRAPRANAEPTEKLDATERLDATEKLHLPLGADPTEVLSRVENTSPTPATPPASPADTTPPRVPGAATRTPSHAPTKAARRGRSVAAPLLAVLGLAGSVLLAIYAWGGMFTIAQLACVIAGAVLFTVTGLIALRTCRGTVGLIVAWILAFVLLFAPLLVWIIAQGGAALTSTLLFGAIGLWISGVAVVALVVAVLGTYLHARAAAQ